MSFFDFIILLSILLWGLFGIKSLLQKNGVGSPKEVVFFQRMFIYHLLVAAFYSYYIRTNGGDANTYWFVNKRFSTDANWSYYFKTGTFFILFMTYPLVKYLSISYLVGGFLFATIGFSGFIYLYIIIRKYVKHPIRFYGIAVFPYILLLPNLHFWSSGIGKDSLSVFCIMLFFYALFDMKKKWFLLLFAVALAYFIRPYIAMFMLGGTFGALVIDGKIKMSYKIILGLCMLIAAAALYQSFLAFLKVDELNTESITEFSETSRTKLSAGSGSAVDQSNASLPVKVFTFLYRPLFFDINNALAVVSSFENLILIWLSILMIMSKPLRAFKAAPMPIKSLVIFFCLTTLAYSLTLSNLGIMLRQKNPAIFCLMIFIFWCMIHARQQKMQKQVV